MVLGIWDFGKMRVELTYRRILILMAIGLIVPGFDTPMARGAPQTQLSLVYTNDVMGEVEPCG